MGLRVFTDQDLAGVHRLVQRTIDACYASAYPPRAVEFFKRLHSRQAFLERARRGLVLVVEETEGIVATGAVLDAEVTGVFVAPERQGHGLGAEVMDALEAAAAAGGARSARLAVSLPSRGFYEHRGYRVLEECSEDVGAGQRLDYWRAEKRLEASPAEDDRPGSTKTA